MHSCDLPVAGADRAGALQEFILQEQKQKYVWGDSEAGAMLGAAVPQGYTSEFPQAHSSLARLVHCRLTVLHVLSFPDRLDGQKQNKKV